MRAFRSRRGVRPFRVARWLHIYSSSALFGLLLFFCLTGITLNHQWYPSDGRQESIDSAPFGAELESLFPSGGDVSTPDLSAIDQHLRSRFDLPTPSAIDLELAAGELFFSYDVPAGTASVTLDLATRRLLVERERGSWIAILNDLHKGRNAGAVWTLVIDASAVLMLLFAVTGLVLLYQNRKRRAGGSLAVVCGVLSPIALYLLAVPRLIF